MPDRAGSWGGIATDNCLFINAIFWILHTGAPWRDLPPDYGDWENTHRRFCRWRDKGLLAQRVSAPDYEWLMIDAEHLLADKAYDTDAICDALPDTPDRGCHSTKTTSEGASGL